MQPERKNAWIGGEPTLVDEEMDQLVRGGAVGSGLRVQVGQKPTPIQIARLLGAFGLPFGGRSRVEGDHRSEVRVIIAERRPEGARPLRFQERQVIRMIAEVDRDQASRRDLEIHSMGREHQVIGGRHPLQKVETGPDLDPIVLVE